MAPNTSLKSPFTAAELDKWKKLLIQRRQEISQDINGLLRDAMEADEGNMAPTHQADRGSDVDLQDISLDMVGNEEEILWQIDRALEKLASAEPVPFGLCEYTRKPIQKTRLKLLPWTPLSIDGATYMEENGLSLQDMIEQEC